MLFRERWADHAREERARVPSRASNRNENGTVLRRNVGFVYRARTTLHNYVQFGEVPENLPALAHVVAREQCRAVIPTGAASWQDMYDLGRPAEVPATSVKSPPNCLASSRYTTCEQDQTG